MEKKSLKGTVRIPREIYETLKMEPFLIAARVSKKKPYWIPIDVSGRALREILKLFSKNLQRNSFSVTVSEEIRFFL